MALEAIGRRLGEIYGRGSWILVSEAAAGLGGAADLLRSWGADRILVIAGARGVGEVPEDIEIFYTGSRGDSIMDGLRAFDRSLVSTEVLEAVERFDPTRSARVFAPVFGAEDAFEGRQVYGSRRPEWRALEDKTTIDAVFSAAGIDVAPHAVVPVSQAPDAAARLSTELGTVWAADNTRGWHGGAEYTRWVPDRAAALEAPDWFSERAEQVRVMPFLDGLPCSIHGYVTPDHVAAFRPVELLIARVVDPPSFRYLGMATTWDPPGVLRERMQEVARKVGRHLAASVGYLGPFSIDGVATGDGFKPTELNPRLSGGLGIQAGAIEGLELGWITRALYEGEISLDGSWLESTVVEGADRRRAVRNGMPFSEPRDADRVDVVLDGGEVRPAGRNRHGELSIGDSSGGSYVLLSLDQEHIPVGHSFASAAVSAARLAADTWDLDLPPLHPAPDLSARVS